MAMNAFQSVDQAADVAAARDKIAAIRSAAMVVQAKVAELAAMRTAWNALVASGVYEAADVTALEDAANLPALTTLLAAVNGYLG